MTKAQELEPWACTCQYCGVQSAILQVAACRLKQDPYKLLGRSYTLLFEFAIALGHSLKRTVNSLSKSARLIPKSGARKSYIMSNEVGLCPL